ncbi:MAG TPA: bacteriochlorophyll 4-vinyl reductase [Rhodospirillaceae bacterium]|nr:bacteriochlorophyll 4-vinyl reductase [Rhodospirillaceae bacterium]
MDLPDAETGKIGPNSVIQLVAALKDAKLEAPASTIFQAAGAADWLTTPPDAMVDEGRVARLHQALRQGLEWPLALAILREAGLRTADYLLAVRIPKPAQCLLSLMPADWAARFLSRAIKANAWTFAGSGQFAVRRGKPTIFEMTGNPLCRGEQASKPVCVWHAAVFERLFEVLVSPGVRVRETACEALGDACCRFEVRHG